MKRSGLHCLLLICLLSILPQPTRAQEKFTVCIGDICRGDGPGAAGYIYGRGFCKGKPWPTPMRRQRQASPAFLKNPARPANHFLTDGAGSGGERGSSSAPAHIWQTLTFPGRSFWQLGVTQRSLSGSRLP